MLTSALLGWQRRRLIRLGVGTGALVSALCTLPLWLGTLFTADLATCFQMRAAVPLLSMTGLFYSMASTFEGILIASGRTFYVALLYAISPAVTSLAIVLGGRALGGKAALITAWVAFACFHAMRLLAFGVRVGLCSKHSVASSNRVDDELAVTEPETDDTQSVR